MSIMLLLILCNFCISPCIHQNHLRIFHICHWLPLSPVSIVFLSSNFYFMPFGASIHVLTFSSTLLPLSLLSFHIWILDILSSLEKKIPNHLSTHREVSLFSLVYVFFQNKFLPSLLFVLLSFLPSSSLPACNVFTERPAIVVSIGPASSLDNSDPDPGLPPARTCCG